MAEGENQEAEGSYIAVTQAVELIPRPFEGNPRKCTEAVESALEVTRPTKHEFLFEFIIAKVQGDAKNKLTRIITYGRH